MFLDTTFPEQASASYCSSATSLAQQLNPSQLQPDNSPARLIDIFFYGLYQDCTILAQHGVKARLPRRAVLHHYQLRLGNHGSLLRQPDARTPGLVLALTPAEISGLYEEAGLHQYHPEAVLVECEDGSPLPALCYITLEPAQEHERNPGYAQRLIQVMAGWGLPTDHIR